MNSPRLGFDCIGSNIIQKASSIDKTVIITRVGTIPNPPDIMLTDCFDFTLPLTQPPLNKQISHKTINPTTSHPPQKKLHFSLILYCIQYIITNSLNKMNAVAISTPAFVESSLCSLYTIYDHEQEEYFSRLPRTMSQRIPSADQFPVHNRKPENNCPPSILRRQKNRGSTHSVSFLFVTVSILNDDGTITRDVFTRLIGSSEMQSHSFIDSKNNAIDKITRLRNSHDKSSKKDKNSSNKKYHLGDKPRSTSHIIFGQGENKSQALASVSSLKIHEYAFVKRRNGEYSYSILADRIITKNPKDGKEEECMVFVTSPEGHSKIMKRKYWADRVCLVKDTCLD